MTSQATASNFKFYSIYTLMGMLGLQLCFFVYIGYKIFMQLQTRNNGLIVTYCLFLLEILGAIAYQSTFITDAKRANDIYNL